MTRIAVIDLSLLKQSVRDDRRAIALQELKRACEETGCFLIVNHGLDQELLTEALHCSMQFFSLPKEEKLKFVTEHDPIGFADYINKDGILDKKEHILFMCPNTPRESLNVWPDNFSGCYRRVVEDVMAGATRVSELAISAILESLGTKAPNVETENFLLFPFYPASLPSELQHPALAAHHDATILTILGELNGVKGLEVLNKGEWVPVEMVPNALFIVVGDILQSWSNGRYKSVMHRVVRGEADRYTLTYAFVPDPNAVIAPLEEPPKYRSFVQGEFLKSKLDAFFNKGKKFSIENYAI